MRRWISEMNRETSVGKKWAFKTKIKAEEKHIYFDNQTVEKGKEKEKMNLSINNMWQVKQNF